MIRTALAGLLAAVSLVIGGEVWASDTANAGSAFLTIVPSARAAAMGEAFQAAGGCVDAQFLNPAAGIGRGETTFSFSHLAWLEGIYYEHLSAGVRFGDSTVGAHVGYMGSGGMEGRDEFDIATGVFKTGSLLGGATFAQALLPELSVGLTSRVIRETLGDRPSMALDFDFGVLGEPIPGLSIGGVLRHVGTPQKFDRVAARLPLTPGAGVAWRPIGERLLVALDIIVPDAKVVVMCMGMEYKPVKYLAARIGYRLDRLSPSGFSGFGSGLGVSAGGIIVDYAYSPFGILGDVHRITLGFTKRLGALRGGAREGAASGSSRLDAGTGAKPLTLPTAANNAEGAVVEIEVPAEGQPSVHLGNVRAVTKEGGKVVISWDATAGVAGYDIFIRNPGKAWRKINKELVPGRTVTLRNPNQGSYEYGVAAVDVTGARGAIETAIWEISLEQQ